MKSAPLHELISTLSPGEKRDFKKRAAGTNYLELFNIIEEMPSYLESSVKTKMSQSNPVFAKNLSFGKNYLYDQIFECLRLIRGREKPLPAPQIAVSEYWANLHILLEKGLTAQAMKLIAKAKKFCQVYHLGLDSLKFMFVERSLVSRFEKKGTLKKLERIQVACQKIQVDLDMELQLFQVYESIFVQARRQDPPRLHKALEEGMSFLEKNEPYFSAEPSFNALIYAHFCKAIKAETFRERASACFEFAAILELYDKDQRVKMANLERYLATVKNYFNNIALTATWFSQGELKKLLDGLQTLKTKDLKISLNIELLSLYAQLLYFLYAKEFERVTTLDNPIQELMAKYKGRMPIDTFLNFHYNLGLAHIMTGLEHADQKKMRLERSLDWLNDIEKLPKVDTRAFLVSMAKVLQIIAHFELGNSELALNRAHSMQLHLKEQKKTNSVEYLIVTTVKKVLKAKIAEKKRELFELLAVKLRAFEDTEQILFWAGLKIKEYC